MLPENECIICLRTKKCYPLTFNKTKDNGVHWICFHCLYDKYIDSCCYFGEASKDGTK